MAMESAPTRRPPRPGVATIALGALLVLSLCPILFVDIPAMVDYPNHLARMSVLTRAGSSSPHPFYEVSWALYPNLAMDLLVPPLARLIGVETATRLLYLAGQILILSGAMALARAARSSVVTAGVAASLLLYSIPFAWAFVNFEFALGLALWGIAAWIGLAGSRPALRLGLHGVLVVLLYVSHLFALGLYGIAIGLYELWRSRQERWSLARTAGSLALMAIPVVVWAALAGALGSSVGGARTEWGFQHKLGWLFFLNGFSREASMALTVVLAVTAYAAARAGHLKLVGAGPWLAAGFGLLYLAMPFRLRDTAFVDVRVLVAAALILPAFLRLELPAGRWRMTVGIVLALVALANLAVVAATQLSYRPDYRALVASFRLLNPGSRVLVGHSGDSPDPPPNYLDYPIYHAPTLAVHYADALVPTLFTYAGKQPISIRETYRHLAPQEGGPVPLDLLLAAADGRLRAETPPYFAGWTRDFDYLYLLGPKVPNPRSALLVPMSEGGRFTLYRIRRGMPAPGATPP